jgi:hypothetical protein
MSQSVLLKMKKGIEKQGKEGIKKEKTVYSGTICMIYTLIFQIQFMYKYR